MPSNQNHSYSYWINRDIQQTHNTPHSDTLVYHPTGMYIHTSFSSFTLHLPPSRRDWTSCSLPSAAATSRSLTTEALDAACHDRNSIQIYVYSVGWDGIIYSSTNPQSITMYVLLPNENIAHASTLGRWTGIHILCWGGSAHLAPWTINNYVILPNRNKVHTHARKVPFIWGGWAQLAPFVGQCGMHTQCGGAESVEIA